LTIANWSLPIVLQVKSAKLPAKQLAMTNWQWSIVCRLWFNLMPLGRKPSISPATVISFARLPDPHE
jgi:hypothetical protein